MTVRPFILSAIAAAAGVVALPGPAPIAGEYIQPFTYADGTQLISLPGWATYDAAGVTTTHEKIAYLQIKDNTLASQAPDYSGSLSHLRDVGSVNQVVRFTISGFFDGLSSTPSTDGYTRVIFGATDHQNLLFFEAFRSESTIPYVKIYQLVDGVESEVWSSNNLTLNSDFGRHITVGDVIQVSLRGSVVNVYCNGVRLTGVGGAATTGYTAGSKAGIGSKCWNARIDDFYCAPLTATSVSVARSLSFWPSSSIGRLITVTGTTTGTPAALQTRVISAVDHSEIVPWTTNASATFGAGTFAVSVFEPIGDLTTRARYITQIRPIEDVNGWSSGNAHAVGLAFANYGQSNSNARNRSGVGIYCDTAYFVKELDTPKNTTDDPWYWSKSDNNSLNSMGRTLSLALGVPVGIINNGVAAQSIKSLGPAGVGFTYANDWTASAAKPWDVLVAQLNKVGGYGYLSGMTWTQGESEAEGAAAFNATDYRNDFSLMDTAFRADLALPGARIIITNVAHRAEPSSGQSEAVANANWTSARATLATIPSYVPNAALSSGLMFIEMGGDLIHVSSAGASEINRRDAQTFLKLSGVSTYDGRGPIITSGTRAGAVITMAVDLNGAASIAGAALTGYEVSTDDFATLKTISDVSVSGGNVVITLAADPGGAVKVRSYAGYNPTITTPAIGTYADGTTIQAEPIYNPITVS